MFERPIGNHRAILIDLYHEGSSAIDELAALVSAGGFEVMAMVTGPLRRVHPKFYYGTGKVEEIAEQLAAHDSQLLIVQQNLSAAQQRNLEKQLSCQVMPRTELILHIFAQRARTYEGQLQVELAQLNHMATRLVGGWQHLERQRGGIGLRGGPGETQLEVDRRLVQQQIKTVEKRLLKVDRNRGQSRRARRRAGLPTVALVGYTNAGKSTLFNRLSGADVLVKDQLFATLDTTLRRVELPGFGDSILADTVGFVSDLPHELVAAFQATLQETREAQLLLHVLDSAEPLLPERIHQVQSVLDQIGAGNVPCLMVYNQVDRVDQPPGPIYDHHQKLIGVRVSALTGVGMECLQKAIIEKLSQQRQGTYRLRIPHSISGIVRHYCHEHFSLQQEQVDEYYVWLVVNAYPQAIDELQQNHPNVKIHLQ